MFTRENGKPNRVVRRMRIRLARISTDIRIRDRLGDYRVLRFP